MTVTAAHPTNSAQDGSDEEAIAGSTVEVDSRLLSAAIEAIASFVAGFEPSRYSGDDAATLVSSFTRAERLCGAGKTLAAKRVAESNRHVVSGHRSAAEWLARETGGSVGEAIDLLTLGQALESQPDVEQAYRGGKLSPSRAKLVANAVKINPRREHELVKGAEKDTLRQLKERCLRAKAEGRSAEDAASAHEAIRRDRRCRTWTDADGAFRLDALLTPDAGAQLLASLTKESDRQFEQARAAGLHEPPQASAADALVALVTGRSDRSSSPDAGPPGGTRSGSRAAGAREPGTTDQPGTIGQPGSADRSGTAGRHSHRAPSATVHLRVDLDALRRGSVCDGDICEIPGVGPVPIQTARSLMGDAITDLVITNGVDVTTVCHLGRSVPAPLKTALIERDGTCVVPGCDVSSGLEIDHWRIAFADGGPASLENLARLCAHHHYLRTHKGFQLQGGPGRWRWYPPKTPKTSKSPKTSGTLKTSGRRKPGRTARGVDKRRPPPRL
jgi:hypothetical protein